MKKTLLTIALCLFSVTAFAEGLYVGSMKSNKYHYPTCKFAQRIDHKNLIYFETVKEALKKGYVPCMICKPPIREDNDGQK